MKMVPKVPKTIYRVKINKLKLSTLQNWSIWANDENLMQTTRKLAIDDYKLQGTSLFQNLHLG